MIFKDLKFEYRCNWVLERNLRVFHNTILVFFHVIKKIIIRKDLKQSANLYHCFLDTLIFSKYFDKL